MGKAEQRAKAGCVPKGSPAHSPSRASADGDDTRTKASPSGPASAVESSLCRGEQEYHPEESSRTTVLRHWLNHPNRPVLADPDVFGSTTEGQLGPGRRAHGGAIHALVGADHDCFPGVVDVEARAGDAGYLHPTRPVPPVGDLVGPKYPDHVAAAAGDRAGSDVHRQARHQVPAVVERVGGQDIVVGSDRDVVIDGVHDRKPQRALAERGVVEADQMTRLVNGDCE